MVILDNGNNLLNIGDVVENVRSGKVGKIINIWGTGQVLVQEDINCFNTHDSGKTLLKIKGEC